MEIKILGTACPNCLNLEKNVRKVIEEHAIEAKITKVTDIMDIISYNVMSTPALVVNDVLVSKGRIPSKEELLSFFSS